MFNLSRTQQKGKQYRINAITYANNVYKNAAKLCIQTAIKQGKADNAIWFRPEDIGEVFYEQNREILTQKRGNGYWLWKPYFVFRMLEDISYGDILVYSDAAIYYLRSIEILITTMNDNNEDMLFFTLEDTRTDAKYSKYDLFEELKLDYDQYAYSAQVDASFMLIRKTDETIRFCKEWLDLCCNKHLLTDEASHLGEKKDFIMHRHDQSILSLLIKKYNIKKSPCVSQYRKLMNGNETHSLQVINHHRFPNASSRIGVRFQQTEIVNMIRYKRYLCNKKTDMLCPLCGDGKEKKLFKYVTFDEYEKAYLHLYGNAINSRDIIKYEYKMWECSECGLVFADPMIPGDSEFYEKITIHDSYYLEHRWEWDPVVQYLRDNNITSILEVGCGTGAFMNYVKERVHDIEIVGIDMTKTTCEKARVRTGLEVFCGTIDDYIKDFPDREFDVVLSFHCLEHVLSPKSYVQNMLSVCKKHGSIINSFPYSDRIVEPWIDCGNLPPHHMTRWNQKSIMNLGKQIGCQVDMIAPIADSSYSYVKTTLVNTFFDFSEHKNVSRKRLLQMCCKHPIITIKEIIRTSLRDIAELSETIDGKKKKRRAPYVVMTHIRKEKFNE